MDEKTIKSRSRLLIDLGKMEKELERIKEMVSTFRINLIAMHKEVGEIKE